MKSTKESVHQLLENQITWLNLQAYYEVQKAEILGRRTQTSFPFHSLRDQSVDNIKSIEGLDILWVEEAQSVSKKSWRTVIPTIRKPGSEIWVTFNPELETDDTYQQFVVQPPPNAVVVKTGYRDNPHLSEELRLEIEHLRPQTRRSTNTSTRECAGRHSPVRSTRMSYSQPPKMAGFAGAI